MISGFSKGIEGGLRSRLTWRTALVCVVICVVGIVSAHRFADDVIRKIVGDRATINHARILTEADLVAKLEELLGTLTLHQQLVVLKAQIAHEAASDMQSQTGAGIEGSSQEILNLVSARLIRQYHVFRSTVERLPKNTDLFTHFLPDYADIQARLSTELESMEALFRAIVSDLSDQDATTEHDLIRETLSRYQLIISQVSSRASLSLGRTISLGADQLVFFTQMVIVGLAFLLSGVIVLLIQWRVQAQIRQTAAEAYEALIGVMEFMDPSWAIDTSGSVIYWNHAVEKLTGIAAADMIGKSDHEYSLPFYGERRKVLIDLILEWDDELKEQYVFIDTLEDGSISAASYHPDLNGGTYLAGSAQLLRTAAGKVIGAIETVKDVTQETQSKEELFKLKGEGQRAMRLAEEKEKQVSLLESLLSLKSLDFINQGISVFDRDLKLLSANQAFLDIQNFPPRLGEPGTKMEDMFRFNAERGEYGEGDAEAQVQDRLALARKFEPHEFERTRGDGGIIHIAGTPIDEGIGGFITVYTDVTKTRRYELQQQEEIKQLESVLHLEAMDHIGVGVAVYDNELRLIRANRAHTELYNFPEALTEPGIPAASLARFLAEQGVYGESDIEDQVSGVVEALASREERKRDLSLPDGRIIEIRSNPLEGGVVLIHSDVTEAREALRKAQSTDPVTGLMTLEAVTDAVKHIFPRLVEAGGQSMGLRLQVDRFGMVNEIYGQNVGDQLLKQVAQRIRGVASNDALIGRAGGNELVLIDQAKDAAAMANAVVKVSREVMKPPFYFRSLDNTRQKISLTLSGGIVLFPQNGTDLDDLINKSRLAMQYAASQGGDSFRFFDWKATRRRFTSDRISIENDLRTALEQDQFFLNYQPQIELQSGDVHGCEALVRWQHPKQGLISPMDFIPVAEETGLIVPIGEWVLRSACQQAKKWQKEGHAPFVLSVNVSAVQFRNDGIVNSIREILEETGLEAKYLELELTESIVADDLDGTRQILDDLKALGLSLAIDDFGTGYSSLAYLTQLPFDTLKIDQAFVRGKEKHNWAIVRAVCQLARTLGLNIVAEGVETGDHADMLTGLGCQIGQGYLFSRPLPPDDLGIYLGGNKRRDAELKGDHRGVRLRVGLPTFAAINQFEKAAMDFRACHPELEMEIQCDVSDHLVEALKLGELDVIVAPTIGQLDIDPLYAWLDKPVWIGSQDFVLAEKEPIPLLVHPDGSPFRRRMLDSLRQIDRQSQVVYQSSALRGLINALTAGMGITALPLSALSDEEAMRTGQIRVLDADKDGLPVLESVRYGVYIRELEPELAHTSQLLLTDFLAELIDSFGCERL